MQNLQSQRLYSDFLLSVAVLFIYVLFTLDNCCNGCPRNVQQEVNH